MSTSVLLEVLIFFVIGLCLLHLILFCVFIAILSQEIMICRNRAWCTRHRTWNHIILAAIPLFGVFIIPVLMVEAIGNIKVISAQNSIEKMDLILKNKDIPSEKFNAITICGSMRYESLFPVIAKELKKYAYIVYTPVSTFSDADINQLEDVEKRSELLNMLLSIHKMKISQSDGGIFVVNKNGYIGDTTLEEIYFAIASNKVVQYMEEPTGYLKQCIDEFTKMRDENKIMEEGNA